MRYFRISERKFRRFYLKESRRALFFCATFEFPQEISLNRDRFSGGIVLAYNACIFEKYG